VTNLDKDAARPPYPEPVPRPGPTEQPAASVASAYDFSDVPAATPDEIGGWLSA
jgi:hypothetical protein